MSLLLLQTFSTFIPEGMRKTKIMKKLSKMLVNHLGLMLTKEDLQSVVDLMEPYGQITNGIELLNPPLEVTSYYCKCSINYFKILSFHQLAVNSLRTYYYTFLS